jgi:hypothetical protein
MSKIVSLTLSLCCLFAAGCKKEGHPGASATNPLISLKLLDGVTARHVPIQIQGQTIDATIFAKDLGEAALFLCEYTLPTGATDKSACEAAINGEIDRCVANAGAEVLSRKAIPVVEQLTYEVLAKSPKMKGHSIRCRVICTGKQIHSLTAVTPDNQDANHRAALDEMFKEFHAK